MAYEYLEKLFGATEDGTPNKLSFEELKTKLETEKLKLVDLSQGGYISKEKFEAKDKELKSTQELLNSANERIKGFEGQDIEGIKKQVSDWETKYNEDTQKLQAQIEADARSYAENLFLGNYNFTSKAARAGVLAELRAKDFKIEDGKIIGGEDFMKGLMADDDYKGAFVAEKEEEPKETEEMPRFSTGRQDKGGDHKSELSSLFNFQTVRPQK